MRKVDEHRYEIIAGERRWRACQKIGVDIDVKPETVTEENLAPAEKESAPESPKEAKEATPTVEPKKEEAPKTEMKKEAPKAETKTEKKLENLQEKK